MNPPGPAYLSGSPSLHPSETFRPKSPAFPPCTPARLPSFQTFPFPQSSLPWPFYLSPPIPVSLPQWNPALLT